MGGLATSHQHGNCQFSLKERCPLYWFVGFFGQEAETDGKEAEEIAETSTSSEKNATSTAAEVELLEKAPLYGAVCRGNGSCFLCAALIDKRSHVGCLPVIGLVSVLVVHHCVRLWDLQ